MFTPVVQKFYDFTRINVLFGGGGLVSYFGSSTLVSKRLILS
jgi:hypothetical protein